MKTVIGGIAGGIIGFTIGYFGKCTTGACPLTSNPMISTIMGVLVGIMLTMPRQ